MDISYLLWLQAIREGASPAVKALFSFLGSHAASIVLLLIPCLVYWCIDKRRGSFALMAYGFSWMANQLIKNTACCYRPWVRDPRVQPDPSAIEGASGYSFPSGHTQSASSMLVGLGWAWHDRKRWPLIAGVALTLLIGFSRNFLGVHTPQDVLVGFIEGCLFVWLMTRLLPWVDQGPGRDARVLAAGIVALALAMAYVTLKPYPQDYVDGVLLVDPAEMLVDCYKSGGGFLGILLGWFIERRWVDFETGGLDWKRCTVRMVFGTLLVLVVYVPIGHALVGLLGEYVGQFLRHLVTFILAVAGAPALFAPLENRLHLAK